MNRKLSVITLVVLMVVPVSATTINIPADYPAIQLGIDSVSDGDTVLVSPGIYTENISWPPTNGIKLIGSGEDDCFIDGDSLTSVIRIEAGGNIDMTTLIKGFTIQNGTTPLNGYPYDCGGGMYLDRSSPTLTGVTFSGNTAIYGGGINLGNSSPTLIGVTFSDNMASSKGGGIYISGSSISGSYVLVNNNYSEGHGGGIFISAGSNIHLNKSTIASNIVGEGNTFGAGIYADGGIAIFCLLYTSPSPRDRG